jgi:dipeptidyl aminopeptidase/acylaminoacyl peptidase
MAVSADASHVVAVRETHEPGGEVQNDLVELATDGSGAILVLASGGDFYSSPRLSPDGRRLAWLSWDHPRMPWDGTSLWVSGYTPGAGVGPPRRVAGGETESIFQPEWSPSGDLWFVSDRTGWWNLYREVSGKVEGTCPMDADFGWPQWVFGMSRYAFCDRDRVVAAFVREGADRLAVIDVAGASPRVDEWDTGFTDVQAVVGDGRGRVAIVAGSSTVPATLLVGSAGEDELSPVRRSFDLDLDAEYLSTARHIAFPTTGGRTAFAFLYAPRNPEASDPEAGVEPSLPPLLVTSHGGPTSAASSGFQLAIQYWTSRGFAVVDVNYGGSTGYGRAYRGRLKGNWGVTDIEDCVAAARYLSAEGLVDGDRMAIRGKSAGGLTTLGALAFHDVFAAGASYFGVADMESLARETHKFESRYLDSLVGPYPEAAETYRERSPILAADRVSCPVILFQGLEDRIVPPSQAEAMIAALESNGRAYAYVVFPEEGHGFRQAESIERSLEAELFFYGRVFDFRPADDIAPVQIRNMASARGD